MDAERENPRDGGPGRRSECVEAHSFASEGEAWMPSGRTPGTEAPVPFGAY